MWRLAILLLPMLLAGCSKESVEVQREVFDSAGSNRLTLYALVERSGNEETYSFDSLAWRWRYGTNWLYRSLITQQRFQRGYPRTRSIVDIDSINATNGTAIIQVCEESAPITNGNTITVNAIYSWRE